GLLALRDLLNHSHEPHQTAGFIENRKRPVPKPAGARTCSDPIFALNLFSRTLAQAHLTHLGAVLRMKTLEPSLRILNHALGGDSPEFIERGTDIQERSGRGIHHPKDLVNVFGKLPELLFASA